MCNLHHWRRGWTPSTPPSPEHCPLPVLFNLFTWHLFVSDLIYGLDYVQDLIVNFAGT